MTTISSFDPTLLSYNPRGFLSSLFIAAAVSYGLAKAISLAWVTDDAFISFPDKKIRADYKRFKEYYFAHINDMEREKYFIKYR